MICFTHRGADAVGMCKACFRGVCGRCASKHPQGLVCSDACAEALEPLKAVAALKRASESPRVKVRRPLAEWFKAFAAAKSPPSAATSPALRLTAPQAKPAVIAAGLLARAKVWQVRPFEFLVYLAVAAGIAAVGALAVG